MVLTLFPVSAFAATQEGSAPDQTPIIPISRLPQPEITIEAEDTFTIGGPFAFTVESDMAGMLSVSVNGLTSMVIDSGWIRANESFAVEVPAMPDVDEAQFVVTVRPASEDVNNPAVSAMEILTATPVDRIDVETITQERPVATSGDWLDADWEFSRMSLGAQHANYSIAGNALTLTTSVGGNGGATESWRERGAFYFQEIPVNSDFRISGYISMEYIFAGNGNNHQSGAGFVARNISTYPTANTQPNADAGMIFSGFQPETNGMQTMQETGFGPVSTFTRRLDNMRDLLGRQVDLDFVEYNRAYFLELVRAGGSVYTFVDGELTRYYREGGGSGALAGVPIFTEQDETLRVGMFVARGFVAEFRDVIVEVFETEVVDIEISTVDAAGHAFAVAQENATDLSDVIFTAILEDDSEVTFTAAEARFTANGVPHHHTVLPTTALGTNTATVSFRGFEQDFTYYVFADTVAGIELLARPLMTTYALGDELNLLGLSVRLTWESGRVTVNGAESVGTILAVSGFNSTAANPALPLTITPFGETAPSVVFTVEVKDMAIDRLEVTNAPNLVFFAGHPVPSLEDLLRGLVLVAVYDDEPNPTTRILTDADVTALGFGTAPFTGNWVAGTHPLTLEFGGAALTLNFVVHAVVLESMYANAYPIRTTFFEGVAATPDFAGIDVRAVRNDGTMTEALVRGVNFEIQHIVPFNINAAGLYPVRIVGLGAYAGLIDYEFYLSVMEAQFADMTQGWRRQVFGESAGTGSNTAQVADTQLPATGHNARRNQGEVPLNAPPLTPSSAGSGRNTHTIEPEHRFRLTTTGGAGKVQDNAVDGLNFVYQRLPYWANYRLESTIEVITMGNVGTTPQNSHQQQSFGIAMRETVDPHGDAGTKTLSNMWYFGPHGARGLRSLSGSPNDRGFEHSIGPRIRNMDTNRWQMSSYYPAPIWGTESMHVWADWGGIEGELEHGPMPDAIVDYFFSSRPVYDWSRLGAAATYTYNGFVHNPAFNIMDVVFERQNNNFSGSATSGRTNPADPASATEVRTWDYTDDTSFTLTEGGYELTQAQAGTGNSRESSDEWIYVGFYTARDAVIEVSNVRMTVTDGRAEKPGRDPVRAPVGPALHFNSSPYASARPTVSTMDYALTFAANAGGTAIIYHNSVQIGSMSITANRQYTFIHEITRGAFNNFAVELFPNPTGNYTSFARVTEFLNVTFADLASGDLYVSPDGVAGEGLAQTTPTTLEDAIERIAPGHTIWMLPGRYEGSIDLHPHHSSTEAEGYKRIFALEGGVFIGPEPATDVNGWYIRSTEVNVFNADFWHVRGIVFDGRSTVGGNNNIIELSTFRFGSESGVWIQSDPVIGGFASGHRELWPSDNLILNVESFGHWDPQAMNADGFAVKLTSGDNNRLIGAIAHHNVDDGFDLFSKAAPIGEVFISHSIAFNNGLPFDRPLSPSAHGVGFKMGGSNVPVMHHLEYSISFGNRATGISSNSNSWGTYRNIVSFNNNGSNISLAQAGAVPPDFRVDNIFSFRTTGSGNDSIAGQGGQGGRVVRPELVVQGFEPHSVYLWGGGASGQSTNDQGREVTPAFFVCIDTPLALALFAGTPAPTDTFGFDHDIIYTPGGAPQSAIDLGGFLELTPYAFQHTGSALDRSELIAALEDADEIDGPASYTAESWAAFVEARNEAQAVYNLGYLVGQGRVDTVVEALRNAIAGLVVATVVPDIMNVAINNTALNWVITIGGTATGNISIDYDAADIPAGVTVAYNATAGTVTVTGVRPTTNVPPVTGTFEITVTRQGVTETITVAVNLTTTWTSGGQGPTPFTVTFAIGGGTHTGGGALVQQVAPGQAAVAPVVTPPEGYRFVRWDTAFTNVTSNITVTAEWEPIAVGPEYEMHPAYVFGNAQGYFLPGEGATRAHVATILARVKLLEFEHGIEALPEGMEAFDAFADVNEDDWFYYYIAWAYDAGLVEGFAGYFRPDDYITREELAAIIVRASGSEKEAEPGDLPFEDADLISSWALYYVYTAFSEGLVIGDGRNFNPLAYSIRADVATITNRILGRIDSWEALEAAEVENKPYAFRFPDVSETAWYFPSILAAANDHRLTRDDDNAIDWKYIIRQTTP